MVDFGDKQSEVNRFHELDSADEVINEYAINIAEELDKSTVEYNYSILVGKTNQQEIQVAVVRRPDEELSPEVLELLDDTDLGGERRDYYLVAYRDNRIVGIKEFGHVESNLGGYSAGGFTAVYEDERGERIGYALEAATNDLCQKEADRLGERITWSVSDANIVDLEKLKKKEIDTAVVEKKRIEHDRWIRLYDGLGFLEVEHAARKKIFNPTVGNPKSKIEEDCMSMILTTSGRGQDFITATSAPVRIDQQVVKGILSNLISGKSERPRDRT